METASAQIRAKKSKKPRPTEEEMRLMHIEKQFTNRTDRQLLEEQIFLLKSQTKYQKSIKDNVQFFFWITLIGMILWAIISVMPNF